MTVEIGDAAPSDSLADKLNDLKTEVTEVVSALEKVTAFVEAHDSVLPENVRNAVDEFAHILGVVDELLKVV